LYIPFLITWLVIDIYRVSKRLETKRRSIYLSYHHDIYPTWNTPWFMSYHFSQIWMRDVEMAVIVYFSF
jgi:hypothetical protein